MAERHATRFIIEVKFKEGTDTWDRSVNSALRGHFPTRELANEAIAAAIKSTVLQYRVRQK